jgi:cytochrome-b5 reductase
MSAGLLNPDYKKDGDQAKAKGGWPEYKLIEKETLSVDSKRLRFSIPLNGVSKLDVGRHIMCRANINDERVVRPYSPTVFMPGDYIELVVKAYEQAKMSKHLHSLNLGQTIEMFGPVGSLKYKAHSFDQLFLIAAGTGITPVSVLD